MVFSRPLAKAREVLKYPEPRLKAVSDAVTVFNADLRDLCDAMGETIVVEVGAGLAAIQIGVPKRVILINEDRETSSKQWRFMINPVIVNTSSVSSIQTEGCLSIPDVFSEITRPADIEVEYFDFRGTRCAGKATGFVSTIIQHEVDHLDGILFIDRLSPLKRAMAVKKYTKLRKLAALEA